MGRLSEVVFGNPDMGPLLWDELVDGTVVWRPPTDAEKAERRVRRAQLFRESKVPWILNDLGGILGFYDDAQDVLSFSRWSGALAAGAAIKAVNKAKGLDNTSAIADAYRFFCPSGRRGKRQLERMVSPWNALGIGIPLALAFSFLPRIPAVGWALLAGQVGLMALGVGLSLGPLVAASLEAQFGLLSQIRFPFGVDGNKRNQLRRTRVLKEAYRAVGVWEYVRWDDRLAGFVATAVTLRDIQPVPPVVIEPSDTFEFKELLSDPFNTLRNLWKSATAFLPNLGAYVANELANPMMRDLMRVVRADDEIGTSKLSEQAKAALRLMHKERCPNLAACVDALEDVVEYTNWVLKAGLPGEATDLPALLYEGLYGGIFGEIINPGPQ